MPIPRVSPTGVTAMEAIAGAFTVKVVELETAPRVAEILAVPAATPAAIPFTSMVAMPFADDAQVTSAVRSRLVPSLYVPVAVNCCEVFTGIEEAAGEMAMALRFTAATVMLKLAVP